MRHNAGMSSSARAFLTALLALAAVSACGRNDRAATANAPIPPPFAMHGSGRIEWRGSEDCADCDGIEIRLALEQLDDRRRYALDETYFAAQEIRFIEMGDWRRDGSTLMLHADNGARRRYRLDDAGRLQALDLRDQPLSDDPQDALLPVAATTAL